MRKKRKEKGKRKYMDEVEKIFEFWKVTFNHQEAKLTNDRKRTILARLKEGYKVEDCEKAIIGRTLSDYRMVGNDERKI